MVVTTEDRLKRKLYVAIAAIIILIISLGIFVKLYVEERGATVVKCRQQYTVALEDAEEVLTDYAKNNFDGERKYREAIAHLSTAQTLLFLTDEPEKNKVAMTELYHAFVKYPNQMSKQIKNVADSLEKISAGKEQQAGYDAIGKIAASIDKLGT